MNVSRELWKPETPALLRGACGPDVETIKAQVESGIAHLYHFTGNETDIWLVTRGEEYPEGNELVILCAAGYGMKDAGEVLKDSARLMGFSCIRYHTPNLAVYKLYEKYGFGGAEVERVYKVDLKGGVNVE
ncbi:hypothetical protein [Marinomonas foliarum]|uniref:N-acetyltransferase domain-containing protein n=1 Tax=Marinomonas foliarum TaxID=491950 RepID=A0A369ACY8_9GAMM|nr:hypothetical protein [Marinomonas foliarum]RCX07051.1 hypothetical protein DFP77_107151 [Marinomonas foliarum]